MKKLLSTKLYLWLLLGFLALVAGILTATVLPYLGSNQEIHYEIVEQFQALPVYGIVADNNFKVLYVEPNSTAQKGGVKTGDILISIDSRALKGNTKSKQAVDKIKSEAKTTRSASIVLMRNGVQLNLDIKPGYNSGSQGAPTPTAVPQGMYYF